MPNLADSHLTYIGAVSNGRNGELAVYDVYPRDSGHQLGQVVKYRTGWFAWEGDGSDGGRPGRTRWEAATRLWGTA